jgi:hypothetical protein
MASNLKLFNRDNRVLAPAHVFINGSPVGYTTDAGLDFQPSEDHVVFQADQSYAPLGANVTAFKGTLKMNIIEPISENFALLQDIKAGATVTAPLAGKLFDLTPSLKKTKYIIEWFQLWTNGSVKHTIVAGNLNKQPQEKPGRKNAVEYDLSFDLVQLNSAYQAGASYIYTAVSAAPTITVTPIDAATTMALAGAVVATATKPFSVLALLDEHWSLAKDSDSTAVTYAPAFGTFTLGGNLTLTDPSKILLTPATALGATTKYNLKIFKTIPFVDNSVMAADLASSFTTTSS